MSIETTSRARSVVEDHLGWSGTALDPVRLESALASGAAVLGQSRAEYVERVERASTPELRALVEQLAVGETYFFRDRGQFAVIERLLRRASTDVRVLCAGCSTGEEPYSIAIMLLSTGARGRVLGMDVSARALEVAKRGVYSRWSLRETPDAAIDEWFESDGKRFSLSPAPRSLVDFRQRNLYRDSISECGEWDVILCRNVLMYHGREAATRIVKKLTRQLAPGGHLFVGHAETLRGLSGELEVHQSDGTFFYRRGPSKVVSAPRPLLPPEPSRTTPASWFDAIQSSTSRIAELSKHDACDTSEASRDRWRGLVHEHVREGDPARALGLLDAAPRPIQDASKALRAALLLMIGRDREAQVVAERLIANGVQLPEAHLVVALCHSHRGELDEALKALERAQAGDPAFAMPVMQAGLHKCRMGSSTDGRRLLARAANLLGSESDERLLLFGGGFSRDALRRICRSSSEGVGA